MPHVIVKLWPGKSEQQKNRLADKIAKDVMDVLNYGEESVSVGFEEIKSQDWKAKVYKPDIEDKDVIYVANAKLNELQKFFTLLNTITGPVITGIVVKGSVK